MRLNVKHKQKLTATEKTKKARAEKKSKGPKLMHEYKSLEPYNVEAVIIPITKMRYGTILSCDLLALNTPEGAINMQYGWLQCLLIMLDTVMVNNPNTFEELFGKNEVTNQFFIVDKMYGKYSLDDNYKAYKIFDSEYYLESTMTPGVIFNALVGLIKCLELPLDGIQFHIMNKDYRDLNKRFSNVTDEELIINFEDAYKLLKKGTHLEYINILDEVVGVHRLDVALLAFCNIVYDKFGIQKLMMLPSNESTGITMVDPEEPNPHIMPIRGSMVAVYTDGDTQGIYKFMKETSNTLGLKPDDIKFKFKMLALKERHPWDVD